MNYGIYIYFDGSDLHEIADDFRTKTKDFLQGENRIELVDILHPRDENMEEDNLTDWDLGVSFNLSDLKLKEIEELLVYFSQLVSGFDHDFAVGYHDKKTGISEDIGFIESDGDYSGTLKILKELKN